MTFPAFNRKKSGRDWSSALDDRIRITLEQLERRREDSSRAMWLAPTLTMAAQAFLLQTLAQGDLSRQARLTVLLAGVAATIAALWSLVRAHAREVQFSEEIDNYTRVHGLGTIRPDELKLLPKLRKADQSDPKCKADQSDPKCGRWCRFWARRDRDVVVFGARQQWLRAYMLWAVALSLFMVADVAVYSATDDYPRWDRGHPAKVADGAEDHAVTQPPSGGSP